MTDGLKDLLSFFERIAASRPTTPFAPGISYSKRDWDSPFGKGQKVKKDFFSKILLTADGHEHNMLSGV